MQACEVGCGEDGRPARGGAHPRGASRGPRGRFGARKWPSNEGSEGNSHASVGPTAECPGDLAQGPGQRGGGAGADSPKRRWRRTARPVRRRHPGRERAPAVARAARRLHPRASARGGRKGCTRNPGRATGSHGNMECRVHNTVCKVSASRDASRGVLRGAMSCGLRCFRPRCAEEAPSLK